MNVGERMDVSFSRNAITHHSFTEICLYISYAFGRRTKRINYLQSEKWWKFNWPIQYPAVIIVPSYQRIRIKNTDAFGIQKKRFETSLNVRIVARIRHSFHCFHFYWASWDMSFRFYSMIQIIFGAWALFVSLFAFAFTWQHLVQCEI